MIWQLYIYLIDYSDCKVSLYVKMGTKLLVYKSAPIHLLLLEKNF